MLPSILFLETDKEDQKNVRTVFPGARILAVPLEGDALVKACKDTEVVSCFIYTKFTRDVLKKLPKLQCICTRSVGFNHIDIDACKEQGIIVCNVPDYGSYVIAEHVFALLLSTMRHIPEADDRVEAGEFDYHGLRGMTLHEKTLGIVGTGRIGVSVAQIAYGFGMKMLAVDRCRTLELVEQYGVEYTDMDTLLSRSDIITLHLPSTAETHHLLNSRAFRKMKDGVIIVNTARGELIDSPALLTALKSGKVAYALLDVLEHERNFRENKGLISHPNAITTPHIAFYSEESMRTMYEDCFTSIREWQSGKCPAHTIKPLQVVCDLPGVRGRKEAKEKKE
ncbi:MAG: NAD(P)-dependent oxidoreductase [Candidatus Peribacteraceae bacterium]|nr:NAD(P)-dependent oxidoreductase [Candidatus Peribacteraceae bacterium]